MFNPDFYPTPVEVINSILVNYDLKDKVVLEPSAGIGNIVKVCQSLGAKDVIACEKQPEFQKILDPICRVISHDFLTVQDSDVSHIDFIIMNPPFSADQRHILHAWEVAPDGCQIIALCNYQTINNRYSSSRRELFSLIESHGTAINLGSVFSDAERKTDVEVGLVTLKKPGESTNEFDGFFMEEENEEQGDGIMSYNFIRDIVNRYVQAVKVFDRQLESAVKINQLTKSFYNGKVGFSCAEDGRLTTRNEFKKDLQKSAWLHIFSLMKMNKYTTSTLKSEMNTFVERQSHIPFTMKNIYHMIDMVVQTHSGRMDRTLIDVFEKLTHHTHENRFNVEGWKTNSHYLMTKRFIMPFVITIGYNGEMRARYESRATNLIEDMQKGIAHIMGDNHELDSFYQFLYADNYEFGKWHDWGYFQFKGFKKGTAHFKFKDDEVWGRYNQHVARVMGYPLYEHK